MYICCLFIWIVYITSVYTACLNSVSDTNPLNITIEAVDESGFKVTTKTVQITRCRKLRKKYPSQCNLQHIGAEDGVCCVACSKLETTCMDQVTRKNPIFVPQGYYEKVLQIDSCSELPRKYPVLCKDHGGEGNKCCQSCKAVTDVECIDDFRTPSGIQIQFGDVFRNCSWYIKNVPCKCANPNIKKSCCASCKNIDTDALGCDCWDRYNRETRRGWSKFISISYIDFDLKLFDTFLDRKRIEHCSEIADWYSIFCDVGSCCASCKDVDANCVDNLYWKSTVKFGDKECQHCNCHDIRQESEMLMKHACANDVKGTNMAMGAREACCHQCRRLGYDKPEGYERDPNLNFRMQQIM